MFVFSNLATSVDGKIATASRKFFPFGTPLDRKHMLVLRRDADCVIMGASTLRSFRKPCLSPGSPRPSMNAIVSNSLEGVSASWPFFTHRAMARVLFVGPRCPKPRIKKFEKSSDIVVLQKPTAKSPHARQIIDALATRGVSSLLVEGGGALMWDFVSQDLVDEYHVTHTPRMVGGATAPTLVDGVGLEPGKVLALQLMQCRIVGDELYLIYRKTGRRI